MLTQINKLKKIYKQLQRDVNSILFPKDDIKNNFIKKLKKLRCDKDKLFVNLYIKLENKNDLFEKNTIPTKTPFVEKKGDIGRSTLYSFDGPFQFSMLTFQTLNFLANQQWILNIVSCL